MFGGNLIKKNIVFKNGTLTMGGGEKVLLNILKGLDKEKYNIFLLIDDDNGDDNVFLADIPKEIITYFLRKNSLVKNVKKYYENKNKNFIDKIFYNYYLWKNIVVGKKKSIDYLSKIEREYGKIDVFIDFNGGARKYVGSIDAKKKIICRHLSMAEYNNNFSKINRYGKYADKYDNIIAVCNNMKDEIVELLPKLEKKIRVIYNPINFEEIENQSKLTSNLTKEENMKLFDDYVLTISRLDNGKKDYDTLIKGYEIAKNNGFNYKLYIIGSGPGKKEIESMIKDKKLSNDIILLGMKKNPYVWLKHCKFFLLSSKEEGFGLVLVESMRLKKAVISSDCPVGPSEILENGQCGMLFNVGDYIALSEDIMMLYKNGVELKRYENLGYNRSKKFSMKTSINLYEKIIDDTLE